VARQRVSSGIPVGRAERLDIRLVREGLAPTRSQAQALILAGRVWVGQRMVTKAGTPVPPDVPVRVEAPVSRYVSRGGRKLEYALRQFRLDPQGWEVVDLGASTGGFTDCWLQHGARRVWAVDVGRGQLAWSLRQDDRVVVHEGLNARYLTLAQLGRETPFDAASVDVSFIGLRLLFEPLLRVVRDQGDVVALIKPQFEAGPDRVGKGGVVRDASVHREVLVEVLSRAQELGLAPLGLVPSPIRGAQGNIEFLTWLKVGGQGRWQPGDVDQAVQDAWNKGGARDE
jgi:23S rRNA (cytidine1920-2'-O)/16S rRNA (cytidine1409-2'-O)-methyltransferase